ncbi:MAG: LysM peptidoglycan-binding domain-containing protein [Anaerolineaceae bacterium]|nr:LysM peptidoglycan-binding domain-containing protein [Anaerolineaceae bacterium]
MTLKKLFHGLLLLALLAVSLTPFTSARAAQPLVEPAQSSVTAYDLIIAMNTLRVSNGLPALIEDPIINAVAQGTAEIMAANQMSWHIGDVRGRIAAAGYGAGMTVWATENFAAGSSFTIDLIMLAWADEAHMIPAVKSAYCHVGAGVATAANGMTYYVLQAAYVSEKACGSYGSTGGGSTTNPGGGSTGSTGGTYGVIVPVKVAEPDAEGKIFHEVLTGQSLWAIAVAYQVTIQDIETWNNISRNDKLQVGQRLFIPSASTEGYATPTPVGMIQVSTPDADGKIVHTVRSYQTLTTIAQAYNVPMDTILALNGWQMDWPLQIDQKLIISAGNVTPSPTPRPLTPVEKLTPASDGKYYHVVQSGETLSWIADLYKINVIDLMGWNGLNNSSILYLDQKLLLQVTPPATITPTPAPATATSTPTPVTPTATPSRTPTLKVSSPTPTVPVSFFERQTPVFWGISGAAVLSAVLLAVGVLTRRKRAE